MASKIICTYTPPNTVAFPWMPRECSPNYRGHWSKKAKAAKAYRKTCWVLSFKLNMAGAHAPGALVVTLQFCPPDKRRRDLDNLLASCKAGLDGLADALGVNDSKFQLHISIGAPVRGGAVHVTIGKGE